MISLTHEQRVAIHRELEASYAYRPDFAHLLLQAIEAGTLTGVSYLTLIEGRPCGCFYSWLSGHAERFVQAYNEHPERFTFDGRTLHSFARMEDYRVPAICFKEDFVIRQGIETNFAGHTPIECYLFACRERENFSELVEMLAPLKARYEQSLSQQHYHDQTPDCPQGYYWNGRQCLQENGNLLRPSLYEHENF
ncbi:MAG: hypothetical protein NVSMB38_40400 [Ktedonobacteraceae bacterium]